MDTEQGRQLTERLFEPDGVVHRASSGVAPGASSNSHSKLLLLALAVGLVLVASAGVGREVVNARALAAQVTYVEQLRDTFVRRQLEIVARANDALLAGELDQAIAMLEVLRDDETDVGKQARTSSVLSTTELAYGRDADLSGIRRELEELERELEGGKDAP